MHIYLVPGFFGFKSLGALNYFHRVSDKLSAALERRGVEATIIESETQPTGSIKNRADRLLQHVIDTGGLEADEVHFIGPSTGGLDIRLLLTPGVRLRESDGEEQLGKITRSATTVCTPHFGTPVANFFITLQGRRLLELLTVLASSDEGRFTLFWSARIISETARIESALRQHETTLSRLSARIFERLTTRRDDPVFRFIEDVSSDQGAILQLTRESMHLFNAAVTDRPGVRYGTLAAAAPPPTAKRIARSGSIKRGALIGLFSLIYRITAREHRHYPYPSPASELESRVQRLLPFELTSKSNDGVVPTLSQLYGHLINVFVADHLDVVGQFRNAGGEPLSDWLPSGAGFDETRFERVWDDVAEFIFSSSGPQAELQL